MKVIVESWRLYEQRVLWEEEFERIFQEMLLQEGVLGNMWNSVKSTVNRFSQWTQQKLEQFVQWSLKKINTFAEKLRTAGKISKKVIYKIHRVLNILKLPKYVKVAAGIVTGLVKLLLPTPEKIQDLLEAFDLLASSNPIDALKKILGFSDIEEYTELAGDIKDFTTDVQNPLKGVSETTRN